MDLVIVFVIGVLAACAVNLAVYRLRYDPLGHSPWNGFGNAIADLLGRPRVATFPTELPREKKRRRAKKEGKDKPRSTEERTLLDAIPIYGWWRIAREEPLRGKRFWLRPMLFEIAFPLFLLWFYSWQVLEGKTVANPARLPGNIFQTSDLFDLFIGSSLLFMFMAAASLIDLDEYEIPDAVIIPGTILGIAWVTLVSTTPQALVVGRIINHAQAFNGYADFSSPRAWPGILEQSSYLSLAIGIGCVLLWCFALMRRVWRVSRGVKVAFWLFFGRLKKETSTLPLLAMGLLGSIAVWAVWQYADAETWRAMLTSLLGMIIGAIIIWTVRIVAAITTGREAMGFGDVTLMAMIGAYLGWQSCVFVFFISPFFALIPALSSAVSRRTTLHPIPFGPFLCMAAVCVVVFWRAIWEWGEQLFQIGWFLPLVLALCVPLLALLLGAWRLIRYLLTRNTA